MNPPEMKKSELVFVPAPARGHMVSTIQFAKLLLERDERISITVLVIKRPHPPNLDSYIEEFAASNSNIRFVHLCHVDPPPPELLKSAENFLSIHIEKHKSLVKDAISNHVVSGPSTKLAGLVVDLFSTPMIDVANELGVPSYVFFPSSAAFLGLLLYLPTRHAQLGTEFSISNPDSTIPVYANPVPSRVLPSFLFDKQNGGYSSMLHHGTRFKETRGFIINTFAELEPHAIESLESRKESAAIYTVGPLLNLELQEHSQSDQKVMKWLDDQPSSTVVFLCFGSLGGFEPPQLAEMATALERSGHRFLWSIQAPPLKDLRVKPAEYTNFSEILPEGFLERTQNRGLVCGWAPQVEVLAHEAVGGFVSHCGWNSILESLWNGVPIATWPIYAEQQSNAFELVKELELAVELTLDYRITSSDKLVMADAIEKAIRLLMDSGNPVRNRVKEVGETGRKALKDGGSSFLSAGRFIEDVLVVKK
ncbi:UDP-glycosyltransferase 71K1-like [Coffea arabica]|uniref:Glycosyltransferase n=1 Tax=Coffea arabica TaxID=13443 RepID=A0A6P6UA90_COFAR|nr:UDP-glycosyltransferase 71K1-like [Coffea arabica]